MAIREISEDELLQWSDSDAVGRCAVMLYTPLCGTCNVALRMLEIVEATSISVPLFKLNVNFTPKLRARWQFASVPCLVLLKNGQPVRFEYTMQSTQHLYDLLKGMN